jgi:hypothetical protein
MGAVKTRQEPEKLDLRVLPHAERDQLPAWEQIEIGRYQPRRIRGSFPGRELG